jgi:hypothetical protein
MRILFLTEMKSLILNLIIKTHDLSVRKKYAKALSCGEEDVYSLLFTGCGF